MTDTVVAQVPAPRPRMLEAVAEDLGARPRTVLMLWAVPAIVLGAAVAAAGVGKPAYKLLVSEDRVYESLQVVLYAGGIALAAVLAVRLARTGRRTVACAYAAAALLLAFLVGEEISWGQRILGFEGAPALVENNRQGEANLHNIRPVELGFRWAQLLVATFGVVLPLALRRRRRSEVLLWLVPPLALVPFFAVLIPWRLYRNLADPPAAAQFFVLELSEAFELVLACAGFAFLVHQLGRLKRERP